LIFTLNQGNRKRRREYVKPKTGLCRNIYGADPVRNRTDSRGRREGELLVANNQDTDDIVIFGLEPASGELVATGHSADVPTLVCFKVM
jgi:hypothetical protein